MSATAEENPEPKDGVQVTINGEVVFFQNADPSGMSICRLGGDNSPVIEALKKALGFFRIEESRVTGDLLPYRPRMLNYLAPGWTIEIVKDEGSL